MNYCDFAALESTPLARDPFEYIVVPGFLRSDRFAEILADYPDVPGPGSHPPAGKTSNPTQDDTNEAITLPT